MIDFKRLSKSIAFAIIYVFILAIILSAWTFFVHFFPTLSLIAACIILFVILIGAIYFFYEQFF